MKNITRQGLDSSVGTNKEEMNGGRDADGKTVVDGATHVKQDTAGSSGKIWEPWTEALRKMALNPEQHGDAILQMTQEAVVITDKFPKGRKHLLVVSRQDGLDSLEDLQSSHIQLLKRMHMLGETWIQSLLHEDPSLVFRLGYHSDPSMRQLHLHVISQDFDSPSLKNKKHWNSFTTTFFRDSRGVIDELESTGRVKPCGDESSLHKLELRCHRCQSVLSNISRLKQHIQLCKFPFPLDLVEKGYLFRTS